MKHYIGNINSVFDCNQLLYEIKTVHVEAHHGHMDLPIDNPFYNESIRQNLNLKNAGYNDHVVEYYHYYSYKHFDIKYRNLFGEFVGATPLACWISEIRPGRCTPWHWDINPDEEEHSKLGELVRYFCFLSPPGVGHVFMTEEDCYYNEVQGSVYQYSNIRAWHAGTNVGLIPKYLLTFNGYKN